MKSRLFVFASFFFGLLVCGRVTAQVSSGQETEQVKKPSRELLLMELDRRRPDEASPFFADRANEELLEKGKLRSRWEEQGVAVYPNTTSYDSVDRVFGKFFRKVKKSVSFKAKEPPASVAIKVMPGASFSLQDRREISATMIVTNQSKQLTQLVFPTEQRFDFVIKDASGSVLERWSDDRVFEKEEGVLMINPGENVQFSGTLSTREMQPGQAYTLEATVAGNSRFAGYFTLNPR